MPNGIDLFSTVHFTQWRAQQGLVYFTASIGESIQL